MKTFIIIFLVILFIFIGLVSFFRWFSKTAQNARTIIYNYPLLAETYHEYVENGSDFDTEFIIFLYNEFRETHSVYSGIERYNRRKQNRQEYLEAGEIVSFCEQAGEKLYHDLSLRGVVFANQKTSDL